MKPLLQKVLSKLSPGNTVNKNYAQWQNYNWEQKGEEWSPSPAWKKSVINDIMLNYIKSGGTILEIGPGAGRWTTTLQNIANRLILVDLSDHCIEMCKERFAEANNIEYFVNNGVSLKFIPDETIDYIWSFDVFVHIEPCDIQKYLVDFTRVCKKGATAVIHHAKEGKGHGGWRSSMTAEKFAAMVTKQKFTLLTQFDSWGDHNQFNVHFHHDIITVFQK